MGRTFQEFMVLCEASDSEDKSKRLGFAATIKTAQAGGRIRPERKKSAPETRRVRHVGGGKTEPVTYKPRKDIGQQRASSERQQQPEQERGSARETQLAAAKEERRKAALARIAAKKAGQSAPATAKPKAKEASQTASKLLSKKTAKKPVSPDYKPAQASGLSTKERNKQTREGERYLRGIMKDQEIKKYEKATGQKPDRKATTKILGHVERRMST